METRRLTYFSQKDIFQFLSLKARRKLARGHRELLRYHQKIPFSFETVSFEYIDDFPVLWKYHKITLDELTWEIRGSEDGLKTVTLPSGKVVEVKSDKDISEGLMKQFLQYYLGRRGTKIQNYCVKGNQFHLDYLTNCHFKTMTIIKRYNDEKLWQNFRNHNITTDLLLMKYRRISLELFHVQGITRKVHLLETDTQFWDIQNALTFFSRDVRERFGIGTVYRGKFFISTTDLPEFLEVTRNEQKAKYKYYGSRSGICLEMPGDRELFVSAIVDDLYGFPEFHGTCQAEVVKKGTTLFYHQLPADLQAKYRELRAQQTQEQARFRANRQRRRKKTLDRQRLWCRHHPWHCLAILILEFLVFLPFGMYFRNAVLLLCAAIVLLATLICFAYMMFSPLRFGEDEEEDDY